jgi:hypothetical protein
MMNFKATAGLLLLGAAGLASAQTYNLYPDNCSSDWTPVWNEGQPQATLTVNSFGVEGSDWQALFTMNVDNTQRCSAESVGDIVLLDPYFEHIPFGQDPYQFQFQLNSSISGLISVGGGVYCLPDFALGLIISPADCSYKSSAYVSSCSHQGAQFPRYCFSEV